MGECRVTLSDRLKDTDGRPSGFDYMRLVLAIGVICWHVAVTSYGDLAQEKVWNSVWWIPFGLILPMFFALSGFLVAGSLERCKTLFMFLGLRVIRIVPALAVEVLISALIIGPLFTIEPLRAYFTSSEFAHYFLNILGDIHYRLPGVFTGNPHDMVNGQLWTVPYELICYVTLAGLAILNVVKDRKKILYFLIFIYAAQACHTVIHPRLENGLASGWSLVMIFLSGIVIYKFKDKVLWDARLFAVCLMASVILISIPNGDRFYGLPIAYITVYMGLFNPRRQKLLLSGDYSYGLFLYGFPIQQACVALGFARYNWYMNILAAVPIAFAIAATSWWLVEKPALKTRKVLQWAEDYYLRRFERFRELRLHVK
jgi:peptidoglycan/LPS O-acetylase OafA/YrhL